jgi:hypothetical protein
MARILRRRVVKPTRAPDKRVSPQEINQWLQLGLSTAKIAEALGDVVPPVLYGGEKEEVGEEAAIADLKASRVFDPLSYERQAVRDRLESPPTGTGSPPGQPTQPPAASGATPAAEQPQPAEVRLMVKGVDGRYAPQGVVSRAQWEEEERVREIAAASKTIKMLNAAARKATTFEEGEALIRRLDEVLESDGVLEFFGFGMGAKRDKAYGVLLKNLKRGSSPELARDYTRMAVRLKVAADARDQAQKGLESREGIAESRVTEAGAARVSRETLSADRIKAQEAQTEARAGLQEDRIEAATTLAGLKQTDRLAVVTAKGKSSRGVKRLAAKLRAKENRLRQGERIALTKLNTRYTRENKALTVWFNAAGKKREQTPGEKQLHKRSLGQAKNLKEVMTQHNSLDQLKLVSEYQQALLMVQAGTLREDLGEEYEAALLAVEMQEAGTRSARVFFSRIQEEIDGLAEDAGYTIKTRLTLPASYLDDIAPPPEATEEAEVEEAARQNAGDILDQFKPSPSEPP